MKTLFVNIYIMLFALLSNILTAQSTALQFNGSDNYIQFTEANTLFETYNNFTVEMWVRSENSAPGCLYAEGITGSNSNQFRIWGSGGKLIVRPINTSSPQLSITDQNGNNLFGAGKPWYHIAIVGTPGSNSGDIDLIVYVNGVNRGELTYTKPSADYDNSLIGKYSGSGGAFDGEIDEFRAWSRALNQSELNINKCSISSTLNLERHLKFNEGSGNSIYEEVSGTNNTLQGTTPTWTSNSNCSTNLVAYYPFNGNANDESANNNNGIVSGASLTNNRFNKSNSAYAFDGISNYIEIPDNDVFSISTTSKLSISVWMRVDQLDFSNYEGTGDYVHWMGKGSNGDKEWLFRMYNKSSPIRPNRTSCYAFNLSGGLGAGSYVEEELTVGEWIHYAMIYDYSTNTIQLYKNGILKDTDMFTDYNITPQNGTTPVRIGTSDFNSFFKGAIDDIRVYDGILTPEEITNLYNESVTLSTKTKVSSPLNKLKLYPNPTSDVLKIYNPENKNISYKVIDSFGRVVKKGQLQKQINMHSLPKGMYIISIKDTNNSQSILNKKIIKI